MNFPVRARKRSNLGALANANESVQRQFVIKEAIALSSQYLSFFFWYSEDIAANPWGSVGLWSARPKSGGSDWALVLS